MKVYLTVQSEVTASGQTLHRAWVHDMNGQIEVAATLDYVLAAAQQRGYEFVGEYAPFAQELHRTPVAIDADFVEAIMLMTGPVPEGFDIEAAVRDWESDADRADYERSH